MRDQIEFVGLRRVGEFEGEILNAIVHEKL
jgi:hypothetical protein